MDKDSMDNSTLMVSVFMITYNHEKYIKKAIDGILMQKVNFSYEIIIGEDCSQDNTRSILNEYFKKYPSKIKLLLHEKNIGMHENVNAVWRECRGKYIASCEGDDYWIDPNKLQKQVNFLERHPQYIGTAHKIQVIDDKGKFLNIQTPFNFKKKDYTLADAKKGLYPGQIATLVFRNILKHNPIDFQSLAECNASGDIKLIVFLSLFGKIYCFDDIMSYYRKVTTHGDSFSARRRGKNLSLRAFTQWEELSQLANCVKNIEIDYREKFSYITAASFFKFCLKPNRENFVIFKELYGRFNKLYNKNTSLEISKEIMKFPFKKFRKFLIKDD